MFEYRGRTCTRTRARVDVIMMIIDVGCTLRYKYDDVIMMTSTSSSIGGCTNQLACIYEHAHARAVVRTKSMHTCRH